MSFRKTFSQSLTKTLFRRRRPCSEIFGNGRPNNFGAPDQIEARRFVSTFRKRPAQRSNEPEIGRVRKQRPEKKGDVLLRAAFRLYVLS